MLVLSRKVGERIVINGDIVVTFVSVRGDRIRLGVEAPKHVSVDRAEVHESKQPVPGGPLVEVTPDGAGETP